MSDLVLYHANCLDGFTAAWCAWLSFGDSAEYRPVQYGPGQDLPDVTGRDVLIVDFSYPRDVLLEMASNAKSVTLLDHHASAQRDLQSIDVRYIPLSNGKEAVVDASDLPLVSQYSWSEAKHGGAVAYAGGGRDAQELVYMHRLILGTDEGIDHVNRNPLDNRRENLRPANKQQNAANMDRGSKWKGVTPRREKWVAQITVSGVHRYLGIFGTPEEAARAYDAAAVEAFGAYARGNFIQPPEPPPLPPRNLRIVFDMGRSGAGITYDELFEDERPPLVDYVEDRDLWRFKLPASKEINAYIGSYDQTFRRWSDISGILRQESERAVVGGSAILRSVDRYCQEMAKQAFIARLGSHDAPCVNAPYINTSELVGHLAERVPALFAFGWFQRGDGLYQYSLRSRGPFDVSELAKQFGGGGHKNAAGFTVEELVHEEVRS
jgi:hypothetical protein